MARRRRDAAPRVWVAPNLHDFCNAGARDEAEGRKRVRKNVSIAHNDPLYVPTEDLVPYHQLTGSLMFPMPGHCSTPYNRSERATTMCIGERPFA